MVRDKVVEIQSSKETKYIKKDTNITIIGRLAYDESGRVMADVIIIITMVIRIKSHI